METEESMPKMTERKSAAVVALLLAELKACRTQLVRLRRLLDELIVEAGR
jgi:hypothetical protein